MNTDKTLTIRAKAFSGEGVRTHKVTADNSGTIRVWDPVAGHYTTCHALSTSAIRRIRKAFAIL